MTDEMRWYRRNYGLHVGDELVLVEMHDHEWLAVGHFSGDDVPLVVPGPGIIGVVPGLTYAVTAPGGLLARYQFADTSGVALDTAGNPLGPFPLTLNEGTSGVDPLGGPQSTWDGSQAPTRGVKDHSELGAGDDGSVRFNYNQRHVVPGVTYPGSFFADATTNPVVGPIQWGTSAGAVKSVGFFVKPSSAQVLDLQPILGYTLFSDTNDGLNGWYFYWKRSTGELGFGCINGGGPPLRSFSLSRSGLAADVWYRVCVTFAPSTNKWTLIINGIAIDSTIKLFSDYAPAVNGGLRVNGLQGWAGSFTDNSQARGFGLFEIDELDIWTVTVTENDERGIFAASGPGYGTTVTNVTVGAGSPYSTVGAVGSGFSPAGYVLAADGAGGTVWEPAAGTYYHNGS
jgi:hypothetical protein